MKNMLKNTLGKLAWICASLVAAGAAAAMADQIPHLEKRGDVSQLIVHGKPYLALAGELRNSSASSPGYGLKFGEEPQLQRAYVYDFR